MMTVYMYGHMVLILGHKGCSLCFLLKVIAVHMHAPLTCYKKESREVVHEVCFKQHHGLSETYKIYILSLIYQQQQLVRQEC